MKERLKNHSVRHLQMLYSVCLFLLLSACAMDVRRSEGSSDKDSPGQAEIVFQNSSLTPLNGGRIADASMLEPGDIILSAGKGITAIGVQLFTVAPVSHAALYVGEGQIIEAVGQGVRRRSLKDALEEEAVAVAFRHPALLPEQAGKIREFAEAQVGKRYNHLGVLLQAPFSIERRVCELPILPSIVREFCIRGVAMIQLGAVSNRSFFCSQFLLEAYRVAGLPITDADPRWISPADILHMREGDVPSMRAHQALTYIGHLKFRESAASNAVLTTL